MENKGRARTWSPAVWRYCVFHVPCACSDLPGIAIEPGLPKHELPSAVGGFGYYLSRVLGRALGCNGLAETIRCHIIDLKGLMTPLDDSPVAFRLTGRQQSVHASLAEKSVAMAALYENALRALRDGSNSGRLFLAAHAIREMTNELPSVMDLPIFADQGKLGDQVNALENAWNGAVKSGCHNDGRWSGTIDGQLERWLARVHNFFQWWRGSRPKRRDVAVNFFRQLDPAGLPLPEPLEKQRADRWLELHNYFVRTAHRAPTTAEDFETCLEALEQLLLDSLFRQPSEDLSIIDAILKEARDA
jgi:hypothetical protein